MTTKKTNQIPWLHNQTTNQIFKTMAVFLKFYFLLQSGNVPPIICMTIISRHNPPRKLQSYRLIRLLGSTLSSNRDLSSNRKKDWSANELSSLKAHRRWPSNCFPVANKIDVCFCCVEFYVCYGDGLGTKNESASVAKRFSLLYVRCEIYFV